MVQYSFQKGRKPLADPGLKPRDSGPLSHYQNVLPPHNFVSADDNCASPFRGNIQYKDHIFNELHGKVQHKREKQLEKNPESESDLPNFDLRYASRARDIERDRNRELAAVRRGLKKVGSEGHHPTFVEIREDERPKKESVVDSLRKAKDAADEDGTGGRAMHQPTYFIDPNLQEVRVSVVSSRTETTYCSIDPSRLRIICVLRSCVSRENHPQFGVLSRIDLLSLPPIFFQVVEKGH